MKLADLLTEPELGLILLTGHDRVDRVVRGVYITDLLDPRRYLSGGELVLSGLMWRGGPSDSESFAAALADAGVAALAAGTARLGSTPPDLVDSCRRHGVPLFEVPVQVSFNAVAERVSGAERRGSARGRRLVAAVASGAGLPEVLVMAAAELGADCWVLSPAGWAAGSGGELGDRERHELTSGFLAAERFPSVRYCPEGEPDAEPFVLWPVDPGSRPRALGWFAVVREEGGKWSAEREALAAELGTAVTLLRSRTEEVRRVGSRPVEAALRKLLGGSAGGPEVTARLEAAGLPAARPLRAVALRAAAGPDIAVTLLQEIAAAWPGEAVTAPLGEGALGLFTGDGCELARLDGRLRETLLRLTPGLPAPAGRAGASGPEPPVSVGVSDTGTTEVLRGAVEEAGYARGLAEHGGGRSAVATAAELASHRALLAPIPDELRRSYRDRLLGELLIYDREHRSDLVHTLRVFLECSGSWSRSSKRLHIHVNTLRYRIQRIEEITGRDLARFPARVDFYLALELDTGAG